MHNKKSNARASSISIKYRLVSGGLWSLSGKGAFLISGFLLNMMIARLLSPESVGNYFLIFSLVQILAIASQFGLNQTIVKLISQNIGMGYPGRAKKAIVYCFSSVLVFSGLLSLLFITVGPYMINLCAVNFNFISNSVYQISCWIVFFAFQGLIVESFRGFHNIKFAMLFDRLLPNVLLLIILFFLSNLSDSYDLEQVIQFSVFAIGVSILIALFILYQNIIKKLSQSEPIAYSNILYTAWPLLVSNLAIFFLTQIDIWIIGIFQTNETVALYGVTKRIAMLANIPLLIVNSVLAPIIAELYAKKEKKRLQKILQESATLVCLPVIILFVMFIFLGKPMLGSLFGEFYQSGSLLLLILTFGNLFNSWTGSCGLTLMMTGNQKVVMKVTLICGAMTALGEFFFLNYFGITGVAAALVIGLVIQNLAMLLLLRKNTQIWTFSKFSRIRIKEMINWRQF